MEKRRYKITEAIHYSAMSRSALYEAHKRGKLAFIKMGRATYIEKAELDRFLDAESREITPSHAAA